MLSRSGGAGRPAGVRGETALWWRTTRVSAESFEIPPGTGLLPGFWGGPQPIPVDEVTVIYLRKPPRKCLASPPEVGGRTTDPDGPPRMCLRPA